MRRSLVLGFALVFGLMAGQVLSRDKPRDEPRVPPEEVTRALEKYGALGPEHAWLKKCEGKYDVRLRATFDPAEPMSETLGTCEDKLILGGLFLREEFDGECPFTHKPIHGIGVTGFDNARRKYQSSYINSLGSGISTCEGTADAAGKVLTFQGTRPNLMTGELMKVRSVFTIVDEKTSTYEEFVPGKDGREFRSLEITYTRK
jgi:hypothetical protein